MRLIYVKTKKQTSFKKRYNRIKHFSSIKKSCNSTSILTSCQFRFEYAYFRFLKKWFKKLISVKYKKTLPAKIWFNIVSNYPLTKKSKNSRMGKGKGSFFRWAILISRNSIIFEFNNIQRWRIKKIKNKWNFTLSKKMLYLV